MAGLKDDTFVLVRDVFLGTELPDPLIVACNVDGGAIRAKHSVVGPRLTFIGADLPLIQVRERLVAHHPLCLFRMGDEWWDCQPSTRWVPQPFLPPQLRDPSERTRISFLLLMRPWGLGRFGVFDLTHRTRSRENSLPLIQDASLNQGETPKWQGYKCLCLVSGDTARDSLAHHILVLEE